MARLFEKYNEQVKGELAKSLEIKNPMAVPRLRKVVVSMGCGSPQANKERLPVAVADIAKITGQKGQIRRAKKAVSNFKLRENMEIGVRVTLRGKRMWEFVDRLFNTAIPRLRDFRGLNPRSFDGRGNYSMGVPDQSIFPEIDVANVTQSQGMNITFVTSARTDEHAKALLVQLGLPLRRAESQAN